MILPIGHEETTVRRLPWVTFAIMLAKLLAHSRAVPLPDPEGARGNPIRVFTDPLAYQREVLQVDC